MRSFNFARLELSAFYSIGFKFRKEHAPFVLNGHGRSTVPASVLKNTVTLSLFLPLF